MNQNPAVVIGGHGKVGRHLVPALQRRGIPVRVASRSGAAYFDWFDRSSWAPALAGARSAYVVHLQNLPSPDAPERLSALCEVAVAEGVQRLVLQSARGWPEAAPAENAVIEAPGLSTAVLRSAWFAQNFSEALLLQPLLAGEVRLPTGDGLEAFVDTRDVAEVAAVLLTEEGHHEHVYEVTGPTLMTFGDAVARIAEVSGRDFRFNSLTVEEFVQELRAKDVPPLCWYMEKEEFVQMEAVLMSHVRNGSTSSATDTVRRLLGREPRDFDAYAKETVTTGVWDGPAA
ncbi:NAD-dependent epimerase/dehydratase family protein [Streptomyces sp. ME02-6991-2A]|uniref:NAD-dependent epimerase/dehydratase family protein n=1 Tax=Streptomyces TaxID=1883 RepID=UPI0010083DB3|nr:NAD-dependent epimerase/dehydratase family protein [Streptomyces sp. ME02-6991-2A]MDX3372973.1 NAD-dependent epimerase/dehydratase family protein [Streptomyces sp. ME02-6991-2A]